MCTNFRLVEEKYGTHFTPSGETASTTNGNGYLDVDTDSSTESEEEDDEGILATGILDDQFHATFEAIRAKDPRVYDGKAIFYADADDEVTDTRNTEKRQMPMYLSDYHRRNLLEAVNDEEHDDERPITYAEQQDDLKRNLVREMHAAAEGFDIDHDADGDGFLIERQPILEVGKGEGKIKPPIKELDVETAEKDPETFLLNFMSTRAWVPSEASNLQPFESDDDENDQRAETFEEAYNLRFEDPKGSNEKLLSHARDAAAKYSVRREDPNARKKTRDAERAKKDAEKQEREREKARLRRLKIADVEEKVRKIKEAAGPRGTELQERDWTAFLDEGWDNDRWEQEMERRFGKDYYAAQVLTDNDDGAVISRPNISKPKWKDDIDIKDLVPSFDAEHEMQKPPFTLTDDDSDRSATRSMNGDGHGRPKNKSKATRKQENNEVKRIARQERQKIEQLVSEDLNAIEDISSMTTKNAGHFRYRETSPMAFGLTAHDILMASDSQLNQYAGLKKTAAFRDADKKRRDKKRLGKKARLRQWRKETFGSEHGPQKTLGEVLAGGAVARPEMKVTGTSKAISAEGTSSRSRSRKSKSKG